MVTSVQRLGFCYYCTIYLLFIYLSFFSFLKIYNMCQPGHAPLVPRMAWAVVATWTFSVSMLVLKWRSSVLSHFPRSAPSLVATAGFASELKSL